MITNLPVPANLPRLHYPLPDYLMDRTRSAHLNKIESGLASEGFEFRRRRPGLRIENGHAIIHLWIEHYFDERWWKIMVGHGSDEPAFTYSMEKFGEFNLAAEEIDDSTGVHIARFIRDPENYRWPLFEHAHTYPGYAWSLEGRRTYNEYQDFYNRRRESIRAKLAAKAAEVEV
jgi:hypothetical protein